MYKDLDETVSVLAVFEKGDMRPFRFYWQSRSFQVARVTGRWKAPKGDTWLRHFSIVDSADNVFHLTYDGA